MIRSIENNVYHGTDTVINQPAPTPAIKPRTEAQRQASRINGAKSRGPRTVAGKAQSRRNAMKHGIRAKRLGPPADARGLDRDYKRIQQELVNEFEPVTYTERCSIDALARDYQRLDFVNQMIDYRTTPPVFNHETMKEQYRKIRRARRDERLVARLLAALKSDEPADLKPVAAEHLAEQVVGWVASIEEDWAEAANERAALIDLDSRDELSDDDRGNLNELREMEKEYQQIKRCRRILNDAERLAEAFRGDREAGKIERRVLIELLTGIRQQALVRAYDDQNVLEIFKQASQNIVEHIAVGPDGLIKLENYRDQIARSIRRNIADLRATCG